MRHHRSPWTSRTSGQLAYEIPSCPPHAEQDEAIEMWFTPEALADLLASVGAMPPESGAKLFGPTERLGVDVVEFDIAGSSRAGGAVYEPDTEWGTSRLEHWIAQDGAEQRIWTGDAHSHPGPVGMPSPKVGPGLGDLGYVEAVFEQNELQNEFLIPILTCTGGSTIVRIAPWVVRRSDPAHPRWVPFRVADSPSFPLRTLNPAFALDLVGDEPPVDFDGDRISTPGEVSVTIDESGRTTVEVEVRDSRITMVVGPSGMVSEARIVDQHGDVRTVGVTGADGDPVASAQRLIELGTHLVTAATPGSPGSHAAPTEGRGDRRTSGLLSGAIHLRHVVVAGVSGGSHMVEKLSRLGPRRITVIDHDVVEAPNLARTAFRVSQIGRFKVDAIREIVADANPAVEVVPLAQDLTTLGPDEVRALLDDADLIVAGTDSFEAQAALNRWSQLTSTPAVFVGLHARAAGGQIIWSIPGETACYRCASAGRYQAATTDDGVVDLAGEPGLLPDVQLVDMFALNVVVGLLERGAATPKGRLIDLLGDRTEIIVTTDPGYEHGRALWDALTADLPRSNDRNRALETYLGLFPVITLPSTADPSCPDCRLHPDPIGGP